MTTVHILKVTIQGKELDFCSLVMASDEFDKFVDELVQTDFFPPADRAMYAAQFRRFQGVPLISRGRKTEWLFERHKVPPHVTKMGITVRGTALQKLGSVIETLERNDPTRDN